MRKKLFLSILKNLRFVPFILFCTLMSVISCDDIFLEDISEDELFLLSPGENVTITQDSVVTFNWDHLAEATGYQLQVVSPDFENSANLWVDTITAENTVSVALADGTYSYGVRAFNSAYSTDYFTRSFTVDRAGDAEDLSEAQITSLVPSGEQETNELLFWWNDIEGATAYRVQIVQPDFVQPERILHDTIVSSAGKLRLPLDKGQYSWRLKAMNSQSESAYFSSDFTVNTEAQESRLELLTPTPDYRTNEASISMSWEPVADADFYVVNVPRHPEGRFISNDNEFSLVLGAADGDYEWSVTAVTNSQQTVLSDTGRFRYMSGMAGGPGLNTPGEGESVSGRVDFRWQRSVDSIRGDSLFLYDDENALLDGFPTYIEADSVIGFDLMPGDYSWSVKSVDLDGQDGELSGTGTFSVQ